MKPPPRSDDIRAMIPAIWDTTTPPWCDNIRAGGTSCLGVAAFHCSRVVGRGAEEFRRICGPVGEPNGNPNNRREDEPSESAACFLEASSGLPALVPTFHKRVRNNWRRSRIGSFISSRPKDPAMTTPPVEWKHSCQVEGMFPYGRRHSRARIADEALVRVSER